MEDLTLTQLFARMDDHLAQQDAYLREAQATNRKIDEHLARQDIYLTTISQALIQQGAVLATAAQLLATVRQEGAVIYEETMRHMRANTQILEALAARLAPPQEETSR